VTKSTYDITGWLIDLLNTFKSRFRRKNHDGEAFLQEWGITNRVLVMPHVGDWYCPINKFSFTDTNSLKND